MGLSQEMKSQSVQYWACGGVGAGLGRAVTCSARRWSPSPCGTVPAGARREGDEGGRLDRCRGQQLGWQPRARRWWAAGREPRCGHRATRPLRNALLPGFLRRTRPAAVPQDPPQLASKSETGMFCCSTVTTLQADGCAGTAAQGAAREAHAEYGTSMPRRSQTLPLMAAQSTTPGCGPTAAVRLAGQSTALGSLLLDGSRHTSTESRLPVLQRVGWEGGVGGWGGRVGWGGSATAGRQAGRQAGGMWAAARGAHMLLQVSQGAAPHSSLSCCCSAAALKPVVQLSLLTTSCRAHRKGKEMKPAVTGSSRPAQPRIGHEQARQAYQAPSGARACMCHTAAPRAAAPHAAAQHCSPIPDPPAAPRPSTHVGVECLGGLGGEAQVLLWRAKVGAGAVLRPHGRPLALVGAWAGQARETVWTVG